MKEWMPASLAALALWSIGGFLPKLTVKYLEPKNALFYEIIGGILLGGILLYHFNFKPQVHTTGICLAIITGVAGAAGALAYLYAASKGPITLVSLVTALYPGFIILAGYFFLGESLTIKQIVGLLFALISLILLGS